MGEACLGGGDKGDGERPRPWDLGGSRDGLSQSLHDLTLTLQELINTTLTQSSLRPRGRPLPSLLNEETTPVSI